MAKVAGRAGLGIVYSAGVGSMSLAAGIVLLPIVASVLGAGPYGVWLFLISITTYIGYGDLGIGSAVAHFTARSRGGDEQWSINTLLSAGFFFSIIMLSVQIPLIAWLAWEYTGSLANEVGLSEQDRIILIIMSCTVTGLAVLRPFAAVLVGSGHLLLERKFQLLGLSIRIVGTLLACFVFRSMAAVAIIETLATALPALLNMIAVLSGRVASIRLERGLSQTIRRMLEYSYKSLATSLTGAVVIQGGTLLVGLVAGPASVTYFNAAYRVYNGVLQMIAWTVDPYRPTLSRLTASNPDAAMRMVRTLVFACFGATALTCGVLMLSDKFLARVWLGDSMPSDTVALTITIMLAGLILNALHLPLVVAGNAAGMPGAFFVPQLVWALLFVGLGFWLGSAWGSVGVAWAMTLPLLVVEPLYIAVAHRRLGLQFIGLWIESVRPVAQVAIPALVTACATYVLALLLAPNSASKLSSWLPGLVYGAACIALLYFLRRRLPLQRLKESLLERM